VADESQFPKSDGDIFYASEANDFSEMKVLDYTAGTTAIFTPSLTGTAKCFISVKGHGAGSGGGASDSAGDIYLKVNDDDVDKVSLRAYGQGASPNLPFCLNYATTFTASVSATACLYGDGDFSSFGNPKITIVQLSNH